MMIIGVVAALIILVIFGVILSFYLIRRRRRRLQLINRNGHANGKTDVKLQSHDDNQQALLHDQVDSNGKTTDNTEHCGIDTSGV